MSIPAGRTRTAAAIASLALAASLLTACGGDDGRTELIWYVNPDSAAPDDFEGAFGQAGIAERCSTDDYVIRTEQLPGDASQQRIQLARRLAAGDTGIDLMSMDPVFTGEFANAGFLEKIPADLAEELTTDTLDGAREGATWDGELAVAPLWANTQLLWYRKSFADKVGLDLGQPVTWEQIITAASDNGGTVGVQANKYEGYVVWINALVQGAGGDIVSDVEAGVDASIDLDSEAGEAAAAVVEQLASSPARMPDLSVSNEGTVLGPFAGDKGAFITNWTFVFQNYADSDIADDLGFAPYPRTVADKPARPPLGGINIGVNADSGHTEEALDALPCITSVENQARYAAETGNMPSSSAAYEEEALTQVYPVELLDAFRAGVDSAGPRPVTPYWSDISSAVQSTWHPAGGVSSSTPKTSASFIRDVLEGSRLL